MINYRAHLVYKCFFRFILKSNPARPSNYTVKSSHKANFAQPWKSCHMSIKNE